MKANLKPWSWRVTRNPAPDSWPDGWIEWQLARGNSGVAYAPNLRAYVGDERARQVHAARRAGHQAGTFTVPEQPLSQLG